MTKKNNEKTNNVLTEDEKFKDIGAFARALMEKAGEAMFDLAKGISSAVGEDYFISVVHYLSKSLNADYVYIAEFIMDNPSRARTLSLIADGTVIDNIEVNLAGTPCETVIGKEVCSYPSGVQERFPEAHMMAKLGVQAYFGATLHGSKGEHLGLLSVMYRNPVKHSEVIESMLKIFASRTSAELERNRAENKLQESEGRYRSIIENSSFGICTFDESGQCVVANKAVADIIGATVGQVLSQNFYEIKSWQKSGMLDAAKKSLETMEKQSRTVHVVSTFGKELLLNSVFVPYYEKGKQFLMFLAEDVTAQKRAEEKLRRAKDELEVKVKKRTAELEKINEELQAEIANHKKTESNLFENEKRFRAVATSTVDLIWEGDVRDNSLKWHGDIDGKLGYDRGEFPRTVSGLMDNIHPDDRENLIKVVEKAVENGQDFHAEYRIRCKNGDYRSWDERGRAIGFDNGRAVQWVGSVTDVTQRRLSQDLLVKNEEKFRKLSHEFNTLLDAIPDRLVLLSPDMKILWSNRAFDSEMNDRCNPDCEQHCYRICCNLPAPCENCPVMKSFQTCKEESAQVRDSDGRVFDKRAFPIMDETRKVINVIEVSRDITARIRMEEESKLVQSRLIHANKMTSLGTLVSGVAHEINNPNSYIMSNTEMFREIWRDAVEVLKEQNSEVKPLVLGGVPFQELVQLTPALLDGITEGSVRIKNIIQGLINFGRPDKSTLDGYIDIEKTIRSSQVILDNHIRKLTDHFHVDCEKNIPPVKGSAKQIEQVIINLIMNALQALPDRGAGVRITSFFDKKEEAVVCKVHDEGVGMPDTIIQNITEPFFTTRSADGGTGLGLSISYTIIKDHKGELLFESKEGEGTTVTVKLPAKREMK